jgi:hypothetical protein
VAYGDDDEWLCYTSPIIREQFILVRELFEYGDDEWFANCYEVRSELWPQIIHILSCPQARVNEFALQDYVIRY